MRKVGVTLAGAVLFGSAALVWSSEASAVPLISFGGCKGVGCKPAQIGASSFSAFAGLGTVGTFTVLASGAAATGALVTTFSSATVLLSSTTGGVVNLALTAQFLEGPIGTNTWVSGFRSDAQTATTHTVTESTFVDNGNGKFTTTTLLSSGTLNSSSTEVLPRMTAEATTTARFSATELYSITLNGCPCSADLKIDLRAQAASLPEPVSLALFGVGLVGLGVARRKWSGLKRWF